MLQAAPAHDAVLDHSPDRVVLRFNTRIEHALSRATIESAGRPPRPVPVRVSAPGTVGPDQLVLALPALRDGTHIVRFRVLAADGHITEGVLRFTVRAAP